MDDPLKQEDNGNKKMKGYKSASSVKQLINIRT
jgi:hypothetical protein